MSASSADEKGDDGRRAHQAEGKLDCSINIDLPYSQSSNSTQDLSNKFHHVISHRPTSIQGLLLRLQDHHPLESSPASILLRPSLPSQRRSSSGQTLVISVLRSPLFCSTSSSRAIVSGQGLAKSRHPSLIACCAFWVNREISEAQYGKLANATMDTMHDSLEELVEGKEGEAGGWEVEYSVRAFLPASRP